MKTRWLTVGNCGVFLAVLLAGSLRLGAQDVFAPVAPAEAGFDAAKLETLDERFAADVAEGKIVGCLAVVARGDQVVYARKFGHRNREADVPMTEDTIFRIYSMTKPVTSVAVMMLVEQGKLGLDEPVSTYLPEFADMQVQTVDQENGAEVTKEVPAERPITVRDLLRHTSGLTYGFFGDSPVDQAYRREGILSREKDLAEMVSKLAKIPLLHQPGTRFQYSVSTDVLGRLVEVAADQPFDQFLAARIFEPLQMKDTFFAVPEAKQHRLAEMYRQGDGGELSPTPRAQSRRFLSDTGFNSGGGGLCSTAHDYLRFCRMLLNRGELDGARLLKPETVAEMTRNQLPGPSGRFQFGLGFSIATGGDYGWGGAAGTRFWINPDRNVIGLFMVQMNPYRGPNYEAEMKRVVYEALQEPARSSR